MFKSLAIVVFLMALAGTQAAVAGDERNAIYTVAPPAPWVELVEPELDSRSPSDGVKGGTYFLLDDTQVSLHEAGREAYSRVTTRTLTAEGLRDSGQINVYVDPTFQTLVLHHIRILRNGQSIEQLGRARITTVPVESDLESRIYNGTYVVNILLEGLRIGDVVDYAYTRRSRDPLWPNHFSFTTRFGSPEPRRLKRLRIVYPLDRRLHYRAFGAQLTPRESVDKEQRELLFEWRDLPAIGDDSSRPSWYSPWPWLEVSDWADWSDVARRAEGLYAPGVGEHESISDAIASIQSGEPTPEARVQRALQFVQEQIRYTSIAIGAGAVRPSPPRTVLRRRFGDCKDKTLLLVALLRGLGIQAMPALVSTTHGHILPDMLPSMSLFDHVIARVSLPSGTFWLDPTNPEQLQPIALLDPPDFEFALPLSALSRGLEAIPRPALSVVRREVDVSIDASGGLQTPASLDVVTRYLGPDVDSMRAVLYATPTAERQKNYLNYYADYYPGIHAVAPPKIEESARHDVIVVSERYRLDSAFNKDPDGLLRLSITADAISPYSEPLGDTVRNSPLGIAFPINIAQSFRIKLPEEWQVKHEVVRVDNPAFQYTSEVRLEKGQLQARYTYVALKDHVPVRELAMYVADRARMNGDLGYQLTKTGAAGSLINYAIAPLPLVVLLVALAGGAWLAVRIYRFDPPPRTPLELRAPVGIGGWLLFPALSAVVLPFVTLWLLGVFFLYVQSDVWLGIVQVASPQARLWVRWALLVCFGATGTLVAVTIAASLLFFKKRTSAPLVLTAAMWGSLLVGGISQSVFIYSGLDQETAAEKFWAQTVRDTFGVLIWSAYLLNSKRVRATFVKGRHAVAPEPADGSSTVSGAPSGAQRQV